MTYSIRQASQKTHRHRVEPWFVDGVPDEGHGLIDRETWAKSDPREVKAAAWRWYKLQIRRQDLNAADKLVLWALVDTLNSKSGASFVTQAGIADMMGLARQTVNRSMNDLLLKNVIWSFVDGMPPAPPSELHTLMVNNLSKPELRQKRRHHVLVGMHWVLKGV